VALRALQSAKAIAQANSEGNMGSAVTITRKPSVAGLALSSVGELDSAGGTVVYSGRAELGNATGPVTYTVGDEVQFFSSGVAIIPVEVDSVPVEPQINDLLRVDASNDPLLTGRLFRIVDVEVSGVLVPSRRLQIVGVARYAGWTDTQVRVRSDGASPSDVPAEWAV